MHYNALFLCIHHGRYLGHWITSRGRRMSSDEMLRLQGMNPHKLTFPPDFTESDIGKLVGNSMSVNVLVRLFARILPAANLWGPIEDPWDIAGSVCVCRR